MNARLRQLRRPSVPPAVDSWIAELLADPDAEEHSGINLIVRDAAYDGSEPLLTSRLSPKAPARRPSDISELSLVLEGDDFEELLPLPRFDESA